MVPGMWRSWQWCVASHHTCLSHQEIQHCFLFIPNMHRNSITWCVSTIKVEAYMHWVWLLRFFFFFQKRHLNPLWQNCHEYLYTVLEFTTSHKHTRNWKNAVFSYCFYLGTVSGKTSTQMMHSIYTKGHRTTLPISHSMSNDAHVLITLTCVTFCLLSTTI